MALIARSANVSAECQLGEDVTIGEGCFIRGRAVLGTGTVLEDGVKIEDGVTIGDHCRIGHGAILKQGTRIGRANQIGEYSVIGGAPLVVGPVESGTLEIGDANIIREFATIQVGTGPGGSTRIGNENFIMPNVQVGHDSSIGSHVTITNKTALCGHVTVRDRAVLGVGVMVHQHCRIGELAMVGAAAYVSQDVAPFVLVDGRSGGIVGLNSVGLRRNGVSRDALVELKQAYRLLFRSGMSRGEVLKALELSSCSHVHRLLTFVQESQRGLTTERRTASARPEKVDDRNSGADTLAFPSSTLHAA